MRFRVNVKELEKYPTSMFVKKMIRVRESPPRMDLPHS
jgi:hypothetical protein